ncbi:hypothetical protein BH09PAT2_BH09PAT2_07110 [soil metagenome]
MNDTDTTQNQYDSEVMAILKSPQTSTSVTKFAGPYIGSLIQQGTSAQVNEET